MHTVDLNGGQWEVWSPNAPDYVPETLSAQVPGCIHLDLLANDKIQDPFYRDNEDYLHWIGESDWTYQRSFEVSKEVLSSERILLRCEGLDTFATITVNDQYVGETDNMFRTYEFDVKPLLQPGENTLQIAFNSVMPYIRAKGDSLRCSGSGKHKLPGNSWIRKEPCNFGWDWGPICVTCGIWRPVQLVAFDEARLTGCQVSQNHNNDGAVSLSVGVEIERTLSQDTALTADVEVQLYGEKIAEQTIQLTDNSGTAELPIETPRLWWPNNMGDQPLYDVNASLHSPETDTPLDSATKRVGLRHIRLRRQPDQWGESFHFEINGVPFFAKGANWIPADVFQPRMTRDRYEHLLVSAVQSNMNMLRVWGGGVYEYDDFYELCDELGICVWQEFMFACAAYPAHDQAFLDSVRAEAVDNVRHLQHHACIALFCGNNEIEQAPMIGDENNQMSWDDYKSLFDDLLSDVVCTYAPDHDYWPSSPHQPHGDRTNVQGEDCGDAHLWGVWHGRQPFEWYRTSQHRFCSEFGFQSFPEPKTVYAYTKPEERNITTYTMERHQRSGTGNQLIIRYMLEWFRLPSRFENVLWLSQIQQGLAIKYAVEHWRRNMPRCMGALYWQLNDCWPVASWSSIDSYGRWKALQYFAAHFFAPMLISGVEDSETGNVDVHVTSDCFEQQNGYFQWTLTDVQGNLLAQDQVSITIPANSSALVYNLDLARDIAQYKARNLMVWLELYAGNEMVSSNLVTFCRPKHFGLADPEISCEIAELDAPGKYRATLSCRRPALWTWIELTDYDAAFSDNFVSLRPGVNKEIDILPVDDLSLDQVKENLVAHSLFDTYE